jgi:hypothetical protein
VQEKTDLIDIKASLNPVSLILVFKMKIRVQNTNNADITYNNAEFQIVHKSSNTLLAEVNQKLNNNVGLNSNGYLELDVNLNLRPNIALIRDIIYEITKGRIILEFKGKFNFKYLVFSMEKNYISPIELVINNQL